MKKSHSVLSVSMDDSAFSSDDERTFSRSSFRFHSRPPLVSLNPSDEKSIRSTSSTVDDDTMAGATHTFSNKENAVFSFFAHISQTETSVVTICQKYENYCREIVGTDDLSLLTLDWRRREIAENTLTEKRRIYQRESDTWALLAYLTSATSHQTGTQLLPLNDLFNNEIMKVEVKNDIYNIFIIKWWLEVIATNTVKPIDFDSAAWVETSLLLSSTRKPTTQPTTTQLTTRTSNQNEIVSKVDPDASQRQNKRIHQIDNIKEKQFLYEIWLLLRNGNINNIISYCSLKQQPWRIASFAGFLWFPSPFSSSFHLSNRKINMSGEWQRLGPYRHVSFSFLFSIYHLFSFHLISSHFISSHLISSHLISSHLISSLLISSHLISSHLISSHLII
jgi:hypothetical protein